MSRYNGPNLKKPSLVGGILCTLMWSVTFADESAQQEGPEPGLTAVFVRMGDQLFRQGGDYDQFCRDRATENRSDVRQEVLTALKRKSEQSWCAVESLVAELQEEGSLQDLRRYWIVNGFACRATGEALKRLSGHDSVSHVYRQPLPFVPALFARATGPPPTDARRRALSTAIEQLRDDGEQPFAVGDCKVPWNLRRIRADRAWIDHDATGAGVVVAICDSGIMVTPSLTTALWKNCVEELNGADDDGNGYVDDLFGYDFSSRSGYVLGDGPRLTHGSMCAGIIAGRPRNSQRLITGVAPRAHIMMLRSYGSFEAYEYALENGADILSMSYMWIQRPLGDYRGLYRLAHEHLAAGGIVSVGGAGNFRRNKPEGQQIALPKDIPCVIAAAGIREDGEQAPFSSEGPCYWDGVLFYDDFGSENPLQKPDVTGCAGGFAVWGRPMLAPRMPKWKVVCDEGDNIGLIIGPQGNSFSGPHAAGVAALMLSVNPKLNAWEVKDLMESTCRDIGEPGRDVKFGAGLLDAEAAVQAAKNAR